MGFSIAGSIRRSESVLVRDGRFNPAAVHYGHGHAAEPYDLENTDDG